MPFKSVFRFLSTRGWSPSGSNGTSGSNSGIDQKWHRAEFIPAGDGNDTSTKMKDQRYQKYQNSTTVRVVGHSTSIPIYDERSGRRIQNSVEQGTGGIVDAPIAAPLAKPEPLADLDKPAVDTRQYSKQATTISSHVPERGIYGSSIVCDYVPKHHKAIKYADEDDTEDDPGIMSEAETSATVGASSHVRRRLGPHGSQIQQLSPYAGLRASPQLSALHQSMNRGYTGNTSPTRLQPNLDTANGVSTLNDPEKKTGIIFLQYQGETKRAVLPVDSNENSSKTAINSLDDLRELFVKAFPDELSPEYLRSSNIKIYIQDTSKSDFFYELDDINDVKDRSVVRLYEPVTRANSPPPPPTQPVPKTPDQIARPQQLALSESETGNLYSNYPRHQSSEDMNYFSEPEFDASGEYRLQKSASANYYGGVNAAYRQHKGHYSTIDRLYGNGNTARSAVGGPPKPERHFGPGIPSGGRSSVRGSYSPPRRNEIATRHLYGHTTSEKEDAYGRIGYRDYVPSPTTDAAVDALYQQQRIRSGSRSGSATPVIDEEARVRMMNMEKQLANLSSLVHSALMSKGVSETMYKDLEVLRKEILSGPPSSSGGTRDDISDTGSVSRFSDLSSEKGSFLSSPDKDGAQAITTQLTSTPVSAVEHAAPVPQPFAASQTPVTQLAPDAKHTLRNAKRRVTEVQSELKNLRRMAQLNAQVSRDVLKDAFDRIKVILNTNQHLHMFAAQAQHQNAADQLAVSTERKWINQEEDRYRTETKRVEKGLSGLEREVEELRQKVVNGERRLRMSEVESFTDSLTQIGRSAANLKNNFPNLEGRLRTVMTSEMEKVVREEKFLKEEPDRLDTALKRCKKLANTMVTMKKLAMVQDPSAYYASSKRPPLPSKSSNEGPSSGAMSPSPYTSDGNQGRGTSPPKEPGKMVNGGSVSSPRTPTGHVLDNLLEELQSAAIYKNGRAVTNGDLVSPTEKRVGFADEIRVMQGRMSGSNDSDTIKRSPKIFPTNSINHNHHQPNSILRSSSSSTSNSFRNQHQQSFLSAGQPERRSASPSPMTDAFRAAVPFLHGGRLGAPVKSPSSVSSEPAIYGHSQEQFGLAVPSPPPRSSSRNIVVSGSIPNSDSASPSVPTSMTFRSEFEKKQKFFSSGGQGRDKTPTAIVQTNAVDDEPRYVKSASSSESINSQDGQRRQRIFGANMETDNVPSSTRNKQDTLEQRQQELMTKQTQNRFVKFQLPDGHRLPPD